jgi:hypothetical protein
MVTEPPLLDRWLDARQVRGPRRTLQQGDELVFTTGPGHLFGVRWVVGSPKPPRELPLHIELPLGLVNEEVIHITPIAERRCRVTFL